jgi:alpha-ketoglutarate-dependent 2,4-dichlorophenoxyacetate dioxygenase
MSASSFEHISVRPLHPLFAAEVTDVDLTEPLPEAVFAEIAAAFDAYSVLVFPEQALDDELMRHATRPEFVYTHHWRQRDLVMWDNRATMHKGSAFDYRNERRVMCRTTVAGDEPTVTAAEAERRIQAAACLAA